VQGLPYDGPKADIWSLGILVFVMVTGRFPWESEDRSAMMREILEGVISFPPDFPPDLRTFVRYCTNLSPSARPAAVDLLQLPWILEEMPEYNKMFGLAAKAGGAASSEGWKGAKGQTVTKQSAKMILMKPQLRSLSADKAKKMGIADWDG
jgi:serine/threonine protein kinase